MNTKVFWLLMLLALLIALWCLYFPYNLDGTRRQKLVPMGADNLNNIANAHSLYNKSAMPKMPALLFWIENGDTLIWNQEWR